MTWQPGDGVLWPLADQLTLTHQVRFGSMLVVGACGRRISHGTRPCSRM